VPNILVVCPRCMYVDLILNAGQCEYVQICTLWALSVSMSMFVIVGDYLHKNTFLSLSLSLSLSLTHSLTHSLTTFDLNRSYDDLWISNKGAIYINYYTLFIDSPFRFYLLFDIINTISARIYSWKDSVEKTFKCTLDWIGKRYKWVAQSSFPFFP